MNSNYGWLLPVQASSFAAEIDKVNIIVHVAMFAIFILWGIFFIYLLVRYRAVPGGKVDRAHMPLWKSLAPDAAVLAFEVLLVALIAIPAWSRIKGTFPAPDRAFRLDIVGEQYNWNFHYPGPDGAFGRRSAEFIDFTNPLGLDPEDEAGKDDVVTVNEMRLPVDEDVLVRLSSKDVIHSFFVPSFRIKQDATPGLVTPVWFKPTREGTYEVTCAQLCGVGHAIMRADVTVAPREEVDAWLAAQKPAEAKPAAPVEEW